jgi:gluconolactonase
MDSRFDLQLEISSPHFARLIAPAPVQRIATHCRWAEGPVYMAHRQHLVWSDIPNNRMLCWHETTGQISTFRSPSNFTNGNTLDLQQRLLSCEHGTRRVSRTEADGSITVVADRFEGQRLNSPNDLVVAKDGAVWFTDPSYGIDSNYEGIQAPSDIGACHVYRVLPHSGTCLRVADDFVRPNGIAFSRDERRLYVSDTGGTHHANGPRHIRVMDVAPDYSLSNHQVFAVCDTGFFDGFRLDHADRLWTSAGDGVHCYDKGGSLLGKVLLPEAAANVVFGGADGLQLFVCATSSVYRITLSEAWRVDP